MKKRAKTVLLPERGDSNDPVQIVVSLGKQRLTVYRKGAAVGSSRISSGQRGFETPHGIFSIIQKKRRHYSNIYRGAPMPYMQRLTWSGIAMHQGVVPGYPASHGCVRLPGAFARSLFGYTEKRMHVVVTDGDPTPRPISHPFLFQPTPVALQSGMGSKQSAMPTEVKYAQNTVGSEARANDAGTQATGTGQPPPRNSAGNVFFDADSAALEAHRQFMRTTRSDRPLRILITRRSERDRIRQAQSLLAGLGYDPGPADGLIGKQTVEAIKAFQTAAGRQAIGYPNPQFYEDLYAQAGISAGQPAYIYVRQDSHEIYSAQVGIKKPDNPLGTHLYVLTDYDRAAGEADWNSITLRGTRFRPTRKVRARNTKKKGEAPEEPVAAAPVMTAGSVLDRIVLPDHVRDHIEDLLTAGSSLIVADGGHTRETGQDTDYIVLTR